LPGKVVDAKERTVCAQFFGRDGHVDRLQQHVGGGSGLGMGGRRPVPEVEKADLLHGMLPVRLDLGHRLTRCWSNL